MMVFRCVFTHKNRFLFFIPLKFADVADTCKNRIDGSYTLKIIFLEKNKVIVGSTKVS